MKSISQGLTHLLVELQLQQDPHRDGFELPLVVEKITIINRVVIFAPSVIIDILRTSIV